MTEYKSEPTEDDKVIVLQLTPEFLGSYIAGWVKPAICNNPLPQRYKFRSAYYQPLQNQYFVLYSTDDAPEGTQPVLINPRTFRIVN